MRWDIPFFTNDGDGNQCMQVCMRICIKYFQGKDYSIAEPDRLTGRRTGYWTWPHQAVTGLGDLGFSVQYFTNAPLEPFLRGEPYIREHYGEDAGKILRYSELPVALKAIQKVLDRKMAKVQELSMDELEDHMRANKIPIVLLDNNIIAGKKGFYQGHFVVMTGFDDGDVFYHDSGPTNPTPHKRVAKALFESARTARGTDSDVILVWKPA